MAISEIAIIIVVALMLFGSKNMPEMIRSIAKGIAQVKNATNEIKNEIVNSADIKEVKEITEIKEIIDTEIKQTKEQLDPSGLNKEVNQIKDDIENLTGPIKRLR
ncbi:MAG: twin-arginine translocase TatA/TatE family subunit [Bacteroidota bacterium]|nr:twin-arginine translocase TatA/TatE family subunit [Bacteroidota bacterium]